MSDSAAVWFIVIGVKRHGPFSFNQLKRMPTFTPDTLVWREGFPNPLPARNVPELKKLFKDTEPSESEPEERQVKPELKSLPPSNELILDWGLLPPPMMMIWFLLAAAILIFIYLRFF